MPVKSDLENFIFGFCQLLFDTLSMVYTHLIFFKELDFLVQFLHTWFFLKRTNYSGFWCFAHHHSGRFYNFLCQISFIFIVKFVSFPFLRKWYRWSVIHGFRLKTGNSRNLAQKIIKTSTVIMGHENVNRVKSYQN